MKLKLTRSALIVIIFAELVGLFGILFLRHYFDLNLKTYQNFINVNFVERTDISTIKQLIYEHEAVMKNYIWEKSPEARVDIRESLALVELKLRHQLNDHIEVMEKSNFGTYKMGLFTSVKDDLITYLNYNAVICAANLDEEGSRQNIEKYVKENVNPLIKHVNNSIKLLESVSQNETDTINRKMSRNFSRCQTISLLSVILMGIACIICFWHSFKVFSSLEKDKNSALEDASHKEERISEIQHRTIIGIAEIIESRSGETGQHVKRTSKFVNMIATKCKEMGVHPEMITEEYIDLITRAAPLHDVGKITISDTILNKPGKLTPEEFEDMKKHALVGGRLIHQFLKGIEDEKYLQIAQDIATYHHEKFNGKGYPYGLSGTDIPLSARIMAIADVFDALVSQRCYKQAMNYNDAFALIDSEAGEHFDPVLVHVFMQIKEEIIENAKQM